MARKSIFRHAGDQSDHRRPCQPPGAGREVAYPPDVEHRGRSNATVRLGYPRTDFFRRWFHRLWTLQEFVLAKEVDLFCGNITIDLAKMLKAARFLSDHQIWMTLSYGNVKRTIHPSILAMSSLQRVVLGDEALEVDFEGCFSNFPASAQIDYET